MKYSNEMNIGNQRKYNNYDVIYYLIDNFEEYTGDE
jgi:hypothetical protein